MENGGNKKSDFYTLKGYRMLSGVELTESMEDYIEMICRICGENGHARIGDLSKMLNVSPSSASKMAHKLQTMGLVAFPRYGVIKPTEQGAALGDYLIMRHQTLERFLTLINGPGNHTREVELIEHFIDERTTHNIGRVTRYLIAHGWTNIAPE